MHRMATLSPSPSKGEGGVGVTLGFLKVGTRERVRAGGRSQGLVPDAHGAMIRARSSGIESSARLPSSSSVAVPRATTSKAAPLHSTV